MQGRWHFIGCRRSVFGRWDAINRRSRSAALERALAPLFAGRHGPKAIAHVAKIDECAIASSPSVIANLADLKVKRSLMW